MWVPFALACVLLGFLLGAPVWTAMAIREQERRYREAYKRLRDLHERSEA